MAAGAAMPLDVMLDLLRDSDDRIEIEIPVTGSLESFDVGLNQVIRKATQAALQKAAVAYVKNALQPLGTILFAAKLVGKAARPRFQPVVFAAGKSSLSGDHVEYTNKIAELLKKRPSLGLTLCGVATNHDEIALAPVPEISLPEAQATPAVTSEMLLALAKARADALKDGLVSLGVDVAQLFDCRASFEPSEDDVPRVEVML
jgi:outer membrane protein OmpA-like peptidoglycan-associated protein